MMQGKDTRFKKKRRDLKHYKNRHAVKKPENPNNPAKPTNPTTSKNTALKSSSSTSGSESDSDSDNREFARKPIESNWARYEEQKLTEAEYAALKENPPEPEEDYTDMVKEHLESKPDVDSAENWYKIDNANQSGTQSTFWFRPHPDYGPCPELGLIPNSTVKFEPSTKPPRTLKSEQPKTPLDIKNEELDEILSLTGKLVSLNDGASGSLIASKDDKTNVVDKKKTDEKLSGLGTNEKKNLQDWLDDI